MRGYSADTFRDACKVQKENSVKRTSKDMWSAHRELAAVEDSGSRVLKIISEKGN